MAPRGLCSLFPASISLFTAFLWLASPPAFASAVPHAGFLPNAGQAPEYVLFHSVGGPVSVAVTRDGILFGNPAVRWPIVAAGSFAAPRAGETLPTRYNFYAGHPIRRTEGVLGCREVIIPQARPGLDLYLTREAGGIGYAWRSPDGEATPASGEVIVFEGAVRVETIDGQHERWSAPWGSFLLERDADGRGGSIRFEEGEARQPGGGTVSPAAGADALRWGTFLGGGSEEGERSHMVVDREGHLLVTGRTTSPDFPVTPGAWDTTYAGSGDVFVARVDSSGSTLHWCTFIGGSQTDHGADLALDGAADFVLTGFTESADFPVTAGVFDTTFGGQRDAFLTRMDVASGTLQWSTFFGATGWDEARAVAWSPSGLFMAGLTFSDDLPITEGVYSDKYGGLGDMFIAKVGAGATDLLWATYLGGSDFDQANDIDQQAGRPTVIGVSFSNNFPTRLDSYQPDYLGEGDAVAAQLSTNGSGFVWGTYLGGASWDAAWCFDRDAAGDLVIGGFTESSDLHVTPGAFDTVFNGQRDAFSLKLSGDGQTLYWCTYLGGFGSDTMWDVVAESTGTLLVTGETSSRFFPTTPGTYDGSQNGYFDAFVSRLDGDGASLLWSTFLGAADNEVGAALALGPPGEFFVYGWTRSDSFPTTPGAWSEELNGVSDAFLVRMAMPEVTSVDDPFSAAPAARLLRATPNPFRGATSIEMRLPAAGRVRVDVHDARGRLRRTIFQGSLPAGPAVLPWNESTDGALPPGVYFIRLQGADVDEAAKVLLLP